MEKAANEVRSKGAALPVFELLLQAIQTHVDREEASRVEYMRLAHSDGDQLVRFLMSLVDQDERHHHELLQRMAASLGVTSGGMVEPLPTIPSPTWRPASDELAAVEAMMHEERASARALGQLACEHVGVYGGLFSMLLDVMALDSQKHQRVLEFILRRMKEQCQVSVVLLEQDHHLRDRLSALGAAFAGKPKAAESIPEISAALTWHMYVEEELLVPKLDEGRFDDMVATVTREHGEMAGLMDAVARLAWADGDTTNAADPASQLCALFEGHSHTAEFVVYRALDALPDGIVRAQLLDQLQTAEPPTGWLCRARRQPQGQREFFTSDPPRLASASQREVTL